MWAKHYKDIPVDTPLQKERIEPGHGIVGCEMHEINGWGDTLTPPPYKKTFIRRLLEAILLRK